MTMLSVNIKGAKTAMKKIKRAKKKAEDLKKAHVKSGEFMEKKVKGRFSSKRSPTGRKWAPLRKKTLQKRRKQKTGRSILSESGQLKRSIRYTVKPGFLKSTVTEIGPRNTFLTQRAMYHHYGRKEKPKMARRVFLGISKMEQQRIGNIFQVHIASQIVSAIR